MKILFTENFRTVLCSSSVGNRDERKTRRKNIDIWRRRERGETIARETIARERDRDKERETE